MCKGQPAAAKRGSRQPLRYRPSAAAAPLRAPSVSATTAGDDGAATDNAGGGAPAPSPADAPAADLVTAPQVPSSVSTVVDVFDGASAATTTTLDLS